MANKQDVVRALAGDRNLFEADLTRADLGGANLARADLSGAYLNGAILHGANLTGAILRGAILHGAHLTGAVLTGAILRGAILHGANLTGANLIDADIREADLSDAILRNAILNGADLLGADLTDATLSNADLRGANLAYAILTEATLARADLRGADLTGAKLRGANLVSADLSRASLVSADLTGARLVRAGLTSANLTGADLEDADLEDADFTGAIGYIPAVVTSGRRRTSGRATGAALKLSAPDAPVDPREFKRRFPKEFDLLARRGLAGRPFRPEAVAAIQKQLASPVEWVVTQQKYKSRTQRYCATPNKVLLLNVDLSDSALTERQRAALSKLAEVSRRSGHPHEKGKLFTIGWVRYCVGSSAWLIEEVQSDVQVARTGLKDPETRTKLASAGIDAESFEEAIAALAPYTEAFYHDAIGLVFEMAKAEGVEVEMLEYEAKREFGSPRGIYTDLPREMGMAMREGSRVLPDESDGIDRVWAYRPNPPRRRRRR